jgi:hypothetical protein
MYSLSSQLFEGITEYILNESNTEIEKSESQKGPISSGRILGDILKQVDRKSEKKYLNDYSYSLFEKKLIQDHRVIFLESLSYESDINKLFFEKSFIKAKAKITFNDTRILQNTIKNFDKIGEALARITHQNEIVETKKRLTELNKQLKDMNQRSRIEAQTKAKINPKKIYENSEMYIDQSYLNDLSLILDYGFKDLFEVRMNWNGRVVSASLKRNFLREEEDMIIKKYSRYTQIEFVLFGLVTRYEKNDPQGFELMENSSTFREVLSNILPRLSDVEMSFIGPLNNEIIVDPIALYAEI